MSVSGAPMRIWWNKNLSKRISKEKLAAHAAHAALAAYGIRYEHPIVVLAAGKARIETMPVHIRDAGLTELEPGTITTGVEDPERFRAPVPGSNDRQLAITVEAELHDILAKALGYPEFHPGEPGHSDEKTNYVTGDHVAAPLATEAGRRIAELTRERNAYATVLADVFTLATDLASTEGADKHPYEHGLAEAGQQLLDLLNRVYVGKTADEVLENATAPADRGGAAE